METIEKHVEKTKNTKESTEEIVTVETIEKFTKTTVRLIKGNNNPGQIINQTFNTKIKVDGPVAQINVAPGGNAVNEMNNNTNFNINIFYDFSLSEIEEWYEESDSQQENIESFRKKYPNQYTELTDRQLAALILSYKSAYRVCFLTTTKLRGTGYLFKKDNDFFILTARHVLSDTEEDKTKHPPIIKEKPPIKEDGSLYDNYYDNFKTRLILAKAYFYYKETGKKKPSGFYVEFDHEQKDIRYGIGKRLEKDYAILKVRNEDYPKFSNFFQLKNFDLLEQCETAKSETYAVIIHYPEDAEKKFSIPDTITVQLPESNDIAYKTNTQNGSSGAPVFNESGGVVAIHYCGKGNSKEGGDDQINFGYLITHDEFEHFEKKICEESRKEINIKNDIKNAAAEEFGKNIKEASNGIRKEPDKENTYYSQANLKREIQAYQPVKDAAHKSYEQALDYLHGTNGVILNYNKAYEGFKFAAEMGHEKAKYELGNCYFYGYGVYPDERMARKCWEKLENKKKNDI